MRGVRKFLSLPAVVIAAAALTLTGAGIAAATSARPAPRLPARATCHLWAVVNSNGSLARTGCPGTTSHLRPITGVYTVLFPVNVRHCAYVGTIGLSGSTGFANPGFITVVAQHNNRKGVYVVTSDSSGSQTDFGFHLAALC
jgi:hypothetical protein